MSSEYSEDTLLRHPGAENEDLNDVKVDPSSSRKHFVNLVWLSFGFFLLFSAFNGTSNILTSLDPTVGFRTSAILYGAFCVGSLLFSTSFISLFGAKWSVLVGAVTYTTFQAANLSGAAHFMYPAGAVLGIGASILWAAQGSYVTIAAANFATAKGQPADTSQGIFQGTFFGIFQVNQVVGNLTSGFIFLYAGDKSSNILFYVFLAISGAGLITLTLLRPEIDQKEDFREESPFSRIASVFKIHADWKMLMLIPVTYYNGLEQGFIMGDFTSLTKESLGTREWVGFSMAVFGVVNALSSVLAGRAMRSFGSVVAFVGFAAHASFLTFIIWGTRFGNFHEFYSKNLWTLFVFAAIAGIGDAIWTTYPNTIIGTLFGDRSMAAFSTMKLWNSLGNVTILLMGKSVELWLKAVIVVSALVVSIIFVLILDFVRKKKAAAAYRSL